MHFPSDYQGNQKPGYHKENVYSYKSSLQEVRHRMEYYNSHYCESAQSVNVGSIKRRLFADVYLQVIQMNGRFSSEFHSQEILVGPDKGIHHDDALDDKV